MKLEYGSHHKLLVPGQPWDFENPPYDVIDLAESMVEFMQNEKGLGLAYNQLNLPGSFNVFCMQGSPENFFLINPRLVYQSAEKIELDESCLSFPGLIFPITRARHVKVRFQGPDQKTYTKTFVDLTARVVQHEMDHLAGRPFWNSLSKLQFDRYVKKAYKNAYKKPRSFPDITYKG